MKSTGAGKMSNRNPNNYDTISDNIKNIILGMPEEEIVRMIYLMRKYTGRVGLVDLRKNIKNQIHNIFMYIIYFLKEQDIDEYEFIRMLEDNGIKLTSVDKRTLKDIRKIYERTYDKITRILELNTYSSIVEDLSFIISTLSLEMALDCSILRTPIIVGIHGYGILEKNYFVNALSEIAAYVGATFRYNPVLSMEELEDLDDDDIFVVRTSGSKNKKSTSNSENSSSKGRIIIFDDEIMNKYIRMKNYDSSNSFNGFLSSMKMIERANSISFIWLPPHFQLFADSDFYRIFDKIIKLDHINEQDKITLVNHILKNIPAISNEDKLKVLSKLENKSDKYKSRNDLAKEIETIAINVILEKIYDDNSGTT